MTSSSVFLTRDEKAVMLAEVDRFVDRNIVPMVERHESTVTSEQLAELTDQATALGVLNPTPDSGTGLWERTATDGQALAVAILRRIASANAGVAWHFHQLALARRLSLQLGAGELLADGPVIAGIQGSYGLARAALARYLRGTQLEVAHAELLCDYFTPSSSTISLVVHAANGWAWLLAPEFDGQQINWVSHSADQLSRQTLHHGHGLSEVSCFAWHPSEATGHRIGLSSESRRIYAETLLVNSLGMMAIALGAVTHGDQLARTYAANRRQGGLMIDQHPGVQQMLASISGTIQTSKAALHRVAARPLVAEDVGEVLAIRSALQPALNQAASDAMQVMGGIGYMRDAGVEKTLRDCNHIGLMGGTPTELRQFVAEWERLA